MKVNEIQVIQLQFCYIEADSRLNIHKSSVNIDNERLSDHEWLKHEGYEFNHG